MSWCQGHAVSLLRYKFIFGLYDTRLSTIFGCFRVEVAVQNGYFTTHVNTTSGWTHVVLNYIGPNNGQGIRMFVDGQEVATGTTRVSRVSSGGDGRVVVGKLFANDISEKYASVQVDELIFFNQALSIDQIRTLNTVI